jgi:hypothetical protein
MATQKPIAFSLLLLGIIAGQAQATGGLDCSAKDKNLQFEMAGSVGRTISMFYLEQQASIEIMLPSIAPKLARQNLQGKIIHSWISADEIRFQFEIDTPEISLTFTVMTKNTGKDSEIGSVFEGSYDLVISADSKNLEAKGNSRCELY